MRQSAQPSPAKDSGSVATLSQEMRGWLRKRGSGVVSSAFRRRFFVLDGHHVFYFKQEPRGSDAGLTRPQGSFTLAHATVRPRGFCGIDVDLIGGRTFVLEADSRELRDMWAAAMQMAAEDASTTKRCLDVADDYSTQLGSETGSNGTTRCMGGSRGAMSQTMKSRGSERTMKSARSEVGSLKTTLTEPTAEEEDDEDELASAEEGNTCCGRCQRMCSVAELSERTKHSLGPLAEFFDGTAIFLFSRVWSDALGTYALRLHPRPGCEAEHRLQPAACDAEASWQAQLAYAAALAPLALLARRACERADGSPRHRALRWLPEAAGWTVGWAVGHACLSLLSTVTAAHPELCSASGSTAPLAEPVVGEPTALGDTPVSGCAAVDIGVAATATALMGVALAVLKPWAELQAASCLGAADGGYLCCGIVCCGSMNTSSSARATNGGGGGSGEADTSCVDAIGRWLEAAYLVGRAAGGTTLMLLWYAAAARAVGLGLHGAPGSTTTQLELLVLWAAVLVSIGAIAAAKLEALADTQRQRLATGLHWSSLGRFPPTLGRRRTHRRLVEALREATDFSRAELQRLDVPDLRSDDYVKVDDQYYRPTDREPTYAFFASHGFVSWAHLLQEVLAFVAGSAVLDVALVLLRPSRTAPDGNDGDHDHDDSGAAAQPTLDRVAQLLRDYGEGGAGNHSAALSGNHSLGRDMASSSLELAAAMAHVSLAGALTLGALAYLLFNGRGEGSLIKLGAAFLRRPPAAERERVERFFLTATLSVLAGSAWLIVAWDSLAMLSAGLEWALTQLRKTQLFDSSTLAALPKQADIIYIALAVGLPAWTALAWALQSGLVPMLSALIGARREHEERNRRTLEERRRLAVHARVRVKRAALLDGPGGGTSSSRRNSILKKTSRPARLADLL